MREERSAFGVAMASSGPRRPARRALSIPLDARDQDQAASTLSAACEDSVGDKLADLGVAQAEHLLGLPGADEEPFEKRDFGLFSHASASIDWPARLGAVQRELAQTEGDAATTGEDKFPNDTGNILNLLGVLWFSKFCRWPGARELLQIFAYVQSG
jgi:hypothetical protein